MIACTSPSHLGCHGHPSLPTGYRPGPAAGSYPRDRPVVGTSGAAARRAGSVAASDPDPGPAHHEIAWTPRLLAHVVAAIRRDGRSVPAPASRLVVLLSPHADVDDPFGSTGFGRQAPGCSAKALAALTMIESAGSGTRLTRPLRYRCSVSHRTREAPGAPSWLIEPTDLKTSFGSRGWHLDSEDLPPPTDPHSVGRPGSLQIDLTNRHQIALKGGLISAPPTSTGR